MAQDDKSQKEPAEGSRENLNVPAATDVNRGSATDSPMERGPGQLSEPGKPEGGQKRPDEEKGEKGGSAQPGAGITNRPIEEEQENQAEVPERGKTKSEDSGSRR